MVEGTDRHEHGPAPGADARWLSGALALILAFMAGEVVAGLAAHSLALISDAAHMLTDAASIALVVVTARLAARPPTGGYTYGLKRAEILSAQANGITLVLLAIWLGYTAIRRLVTPPAVSGGTMIGQLLERLSETQACGFEELFADAHDRGSLIVTFLALLEMIRLKLVRVFQSGSFGPIRVYKRSRPVDAPHPIGDPEGHRG